MNSVLTMPACTVERALASMEAYWRDVLKLPGVPNIEARDLSNYTVVDTYLEIKRVQESRVIIYD